MGIQRAGYVAQMKEKRYIYWILVGKCCEKDTEKEMGG